MRYKNLPNQFGKRVRQLRKARGYSQEAFAYACSIDRSYMGIIERGEKNISLIQIAKIADTLKISISELLKEL